MPTKTRCSGQKCIRPHTDQDLINKASAELVEELLECTARNIGTPWFVTISRKMKWLVKAVKRNSN